MLFSAVSAWKMHETYQKGMGLLFDKQADDDRDFNCFNKFVLKANLIIAALQFMNITSADWLYTPTEEKMINLIRENILFTNAKFLYAELHDGFSCPTEIRPK